jgi:hypothetical protein
MHPSAGAHQAVKPRHLLLHALLGFALLGADCTQGSAPQCRLDRDCAQDELCVNEVCTKKDVCSGDEQCEDVERCDVLTGACVLRTGFGQECGPNNNNAPCAPGQFCALGACRDTSSATQCARRLQCPVGFVCDRQSFYCIEEADCRLSTSYPELACDPGDACDANIGVCVSNAPAECTPTMVPTGCASGEFCSGAGRCVQCLSNQNCGQGLRCNTRAGLCESASACRSDSECRAPLVCDRVTALCVVPQPPCTSDFQCALGEFCDASLGTCQPREGACKDDRLEQNDSAPDAQMVSLEGAVLDLSDLQLCPNDADTFAVALEAGDQLTAEVLGARASARAEISALGPDGLATLRFAEAPPRGNGRVSFVAQTSALHYVRVYSAAGQSAYQLRFTRTFAGVCEPDLFEPNNILFDATPLGAGSTSLTLCPGDVDWFRVVTPAEPGRTLVVQMQGPAGQNMDLRVMDANGFVTLAQSMLGGSTHELRYRAELASTPLALGVTPFSDGTGPYTLQLSFLPPYQCVADPFESPAGTSSSSSASSGAGSASVAASSSVAAVSSLSSSASAGSASGAERPSSAGSASAGTSASAADPVSSSASSVPSTASSSGASSAPVASSLGDASSMVAASSGVVAGSSASVGSGGGSAGSGIGGSGSASASSLMGAGTSALVSSGPSPSSVGGASSAAASSGSLADASSSLLASSAQTQVSSAAPAASSVGSSSAATVSSSAAPPSSSGVPVVGNNTLASATPVGLDGLDAQLSVCVGDEDWFRVEARSHQRVLVTASWDLGNAGVRVEAFSATGDWLGAAQGVASSALSAPGNAQGFVYVRVLAPNTQSPYRLRLDVQRNDVCEPDAAEFNNTALFAGPAVPEGVFTLCGNDVDLFRVNAGGGARVRATLTFSTADGDLDLAVLLPDGTTALQRSDGVTGVETVDVDLPANPPEGGAYFISVYSGRSDTTARYVLETQVVQP